MTASKNPFAGRTAAAPRPASSEHTEAKQPAKPKPKRSTYPKTTFYQNSDARARMRATFLATQAQEGDTSLSGFIDRAIEAEVTRRERLYNNGQPFPTTYQNVSRGRPLSE